MSQNIARNISLRSARYKCIFNLVIPVDARKRFYIALSYIPSHLRHFSMQALTFKNYGLTKHSTRVSPSAVVLARLYARSIMVKCGVLNGY